MSLLGWTLPIGAEPVSQGVRFRVWAPGWERVEVVIYGPAAEAVHPLEPEGEGYFSATVPGVSAGARYRYRFDGGECFPDPAARSQPDGVHGPSEVLDPETFAWSDRDWAGVRMEDLVLYELHVGTFTPEGTFAAAAERLGELADLGVTAIEVMPIAEFVGGRNWGYDGVFLYAPSHAYGGAEGFKRLVDAAHRAGLGVILDVVYNHFGPEGNYIPAITRGRFFTERHHTPWGAAIDYDGPHSRPVRDFVLQNALYWANEYHVDGLRLDATHAIIDDSPVHLLRELGESLHALRPPRLLIAEDERNERALLLPPERGGLGLDAVWADDLHHQLRRLPAGDHEGYFASYSGTAAAVAETLRRGWYHDGEAGNAERGTPAEGIPPMRFVHCIQNHDQVGNRALGNRLTDDVDGAVYRALSALLLLSPYTPLLWMGQEWAASTPFLYFTDHPPELGRLVTEGRREEFRHFSAFRDPEQRARIPAPQDEETFLRSRLDRSERERQPHSGTLALYRELIRLRRRHPALADRSRAGFSVESVSRQAVALHRRAGDAGLLLVANLAGDLQLDLGPIAGEPRGRGWRILLSTEETRFGGAGEGSTLEGEMLEMAGPAGVVLQGETQA